MFIISAIHLGLVMQEVNLAVADLPIANFQTQIVLSVFQVRLPSKLLVLYINLRKPLQFVIGDLVLIWR